MRHLSFLLFVCAFFTLASCSRKSHPSGSEDNGKMVTEKGQASYYGDKFEGRKTANGEIFSQQKMTAAHRTLPFGTIVVVKNISNGKTVKVRINDRGPFVSGRIIDLSRAAAAALGYINAGLASVEISYLKAK